jgi:hypothetical protein
MNHSSSGSLTLKQALLGFLQAKEAEALSPHTLYTYRRQLECWIDRVGDRPAGEATTQKLRAYLAWPRTEYQPRRVTGKTQPLAPKTLRNIVDELMSEFLSAGAKGKGGDELGARIRGDPEPLGLGGAIEFQADFIELDTR